jgi:hypothetical protein
MKPLHPLQVTPETLRLLRFVFAMNNERQYHILERLLKAEAGRALDMEVAVHKLLIL